MDISLLPQNKKSGVQRIRISSSIENFRAKLLRRTNLQEYKFPQDIFKKTLFVGLYHPFDYLRLIFHRGQRTVFWTGGDILNFKKNYRGNRIWRKILLLINVRHICENIVEHECLLEMGIKSEIRPMIFDVPVVEVAYKPGKKVHVYMCCPPGREVEYGVDLIDNIAFAFEDIVFHIYGTSYKLTHDNVRFHGQVAPDQFAKEIKEYHCGLRWNEFDGFSEVTARSALLAQYPISRMYNPHVTYAPTITDLISALKDLKNKKRPNLIAQKYWEDRLEKSLRAVLS